MIYLDYCLCGEDAASQRSAARKLRADLLYNAFGIENAKDRIRTAKGGKPYIEGEDVDFSDSHTEFAAAVSACGNGTKNCGLVISDIKAKKTGVDIECENRNIKPSAMALISKKLFSEKEKEYLALGTPGDKSRFLSVWIKKESIIKATGEGLSGIHKADTYSFDGVFLDTRRVIIDGRSYVISVAAI